MTVVLHVIVTVGTIVKMEHARKARRNIRISIYTASNKVFFKNGFTIFNVAFVLMFFIFFIFIRFSNVYVRLIVLNFGRKTSLDYS